MSHLGTKILYGVLNKTDDIACERVFSPWLDCEAELRARGLPLVTLETATPLGEFDVVGFSLQYELTYTNVLTMLDLGGDPAARGRPRRRRAAGHRRRPDRHAPRAAGAVHRRVLHRRGRGGAAAAGARGGGAAARGRPAARAARAGWPRSIRSTSPSSTRPSSTPRPASWWSARRSIRACRRGRGARWSPTSTASRSPTIRRCRTPRRSSTAWRSRSRAAAPRGAASARRG